MVRVDAAHSLCCALMCTRALDYSAGLTTVFSLLFGLYRIYMALRFARPQMWELSVSRTH